jgi:Fe-S-cluster containining protein
MSASVVTWTGSSAEGNVSERLENYFRTRADLGNRESEFQCVPACTRPGCKNQNLQVPVSLFDVIGAALHRGDTVSGVCFSNYSLSVLSVDGHDWIRAVSLRLRKPCPYLEDERCSIYPVRPLPCMLFPENLVVDGTLQEKAKEQQFKNYLCLPRDMGVSPRRAELIGQLREMWNREWLLSSFYLFHYSPFYIDFSELKDILVKTAGDLDSTFQQDKSRLQPYIPFQAMEHVFLNRIATCEPLAGVAEKICSLDDPEGQESLLQLAQNHILFEAFTRSDDDRAMVFRLVNGRLKARKQSLIPAEYRYL